MAPLVAAAELVSRPLVLEPLLDEWLAKAEAREWVWGEWDCLMAPCDWARQLTGRDPASAWRGRYDSETEAMANLAAGGGIVRLVDFTLRAHGWTRTKNACAGDFGIVSPLGRRAPAFGAVRLASVWAIATSEGMLMTAEVRVRAAWTPQQPEAINA